MEEVGMQTMDMYIIQRGNKVISIGTWYTDCPSNIYTPILCLDASELSRSRD